MVGAALEYLVIAHDCPDANFEDLTAEYQLHSEDHISDGLRWFFCAGLAVGLLCMGIPPTAGPKFTPSLIYSNYLSDTRSRRIREAQHPQTQTPRHPRRRRHRDPSPPPRPRLEQSTTHWHCHCSVMVRDWDRDLGECVYYAYLVRGEEEKGVYV